MTQIKLPKIRKYHVYVPGNKAGISTDCPELAHKRAILSNGAVYEDTRYNARKRLQRLYVRLLWESRLPGVIDYPALIETDFANQ